MMLVDDVWLTYSGLFELEGHRGKVLREFPPDAFRRPLPRTPRHSGQRVTKLAYTPKFRLIMKELIISKISYTSDFDSTLMIYSD